MSLNVILVIFSPSPYRLNTEFTHFNSHIHVKAHYAHTQAITPKPVVLWPTDERLFPRCFYCGNKSILSTFLLKRITSDLSSLEGQKTSTEC